MYEVTLILNSLGGESQTVWLCDKLGEQPDVEINRADSGDSGISLTVFTVEVEPLLTSLKAMPEVLEVPEDMTSLPSLKKTFYVTLKPI